MRDHPDPGRHLPNWARKKIKEMMVAYGALTPAQQDKAFWRLHGDQLIKEPRPKPPRAPEPEPEL